MLVYRLLQNPFCALPFRLPLIQESNDPKKLRQDKRVSAPQGARSLFTIWVRCWESIQRDGALSHITPEPA